jgi:hypothetical protein
MKKLVFQGVICSGIGKHRRLGVPGRAEVPGAPGDWPEVLVPGSLNIRVRPDGYPPGFSFRGVDMLDNGHFRPTFIVSRNLFKNNKLRPTADRADTGTAQVWRAQLRVIASQKTAAAWVLRRIGSVLKDQIEIVSDQPLRSVLELRDGDEVVVEIES